MTFYLLKDKWWVIKTGLKGSTTWNNMKSNYNFLLILDGNYRAWCYNFMKFYLFYAYFFSSIGCRYRIMDLDIEIAWSGGSLQSVVITKSNSQQIIWSRKMWGEQMFEGKTISLWRETTGWDLWQISLLCFNFELLWSHHYHWLTARCSQPSQSPENCYQAGETG